jgi:hypothetical protein
LKSTAITILFITISFSCRSAGIAGDFQQVLQNYDNPWYKEPHFFLNSHQFASELETKDFLGMACKQPVVL